MLKVVLLAVTTAATVLFFQNCGKIGSPADMASESSGGGGNNAAGGGNVPSIKVSQPADQTSDLGKTLTLPITVTAPADYSGTLKLNVLTPELAAIDKGQGITFSFSPGTLAFTGAGSQQTTLTVNVTTMAPSFSGSVFHIQAIDQANSRIVTVVDVKLTVNAVYEVDLNGQVTPGKAVPEKWSIATGAVIGFISHPEGLTFKAVNNDVEIHRVHSSGGPIQHEPNDLAPGMTYTQMVPAGTTAVTSQIYCHDHEGGGQSRTFQFNKPVVPVAPVGPSGNANATFTYLNSHVFQPMCVTCHSGAAAAAGVDLSSYAMVSQFVTSGNASVSTVYNVVAPPNPTMPKGGTPLTADLVKDMEDWINDGAANN